MLQRSVALLSLLSFLAAAGAARADDRIEIGGLVGVHVFSDDLELGAFDVPRPDTPQSGLAFGPRVGFSLSEWISLEGELAIMPTKSREAGTDVVVFGWRAHGLVHLLGDDAALRPFAVLGVGALTSSSEDRRVLDEDTDAALHGGLGVKLDVDDSWGVRLDARVLLPPTTGGNLVTTDYELFAGIYQRFPQKAEAAAPADADRDGDGIPDARDRCPDDAEDVDGHQDDDGCPEPDNDADGIPDADDLCPLEPETVTGVQDDDGCPEQDADGDGVVDPVDRCPGEPEDLDGHQDEDGCPDRDNDGDGLPDAADRCPDEAEVINGFADGDGCPDELPAETSEVPALLEQVRFTRRDAIDRRSHAALDRLASILAAHPELAGELRVHTDDRGAEEANLERSQRQAEALVAYLVARGAGAGQIEARGLGESEPVIPQKTAAARAKNRRVELVFRAAPDAAAPANGEPAAEDEP